MFGSHTINVSWIDAKLIVSFSIDPSGKEEFCLSSGLEFESILFWSRVVILDLRDNQSTRSFSILSRIDLVFSPN